MKHYYPGAEIDGSVLKNENHNWGKIKIGKDNKKPI